MKILVNHLSSTSRQRYTLCKRILIVHVNVKNIDFLCIYNEIESRLMKIRTVTLHL